MLFQHKIIPMSRSLLSLFVLLTVSSPVFTEPTNFGAPFPLTNTRYVASGGVPKLVSNGRDLYLFWTDGERIRASRYERGNPRVGRAVMQAPQSSGDHPFDVAWNGTQFLVVAAIANANPPRVEGQIVASNGVPLGSTFTIVENAYSAYAASNGRETLLVYNAPDGLRAMLLGPDGLPAGEPVLISNGGTGIKLIKNDNGFALLFGDGGGMHFVTIDRQGKVSSESSRRAAHGFISALASDGRRHLAIITEQTEVRAYLVDEQGRFTSAVLLHTNVSAPALDHALEANAAWNGSAWMVTLLIAGPALGELHVLELDAEVTREVSRERRDSHTHSSSLLAAGSRVFTAWRPRNGPPVTPASTPSRAPIGITELPLSNGHEIAAYAPSQQKLLATAASADATLVVWRDRGDGRDALRAGVMRRDGSWTEREIAPHVTDHVVAGSDGREFIVVYEHDFNGAVIRLDSNGVPVGAPVQTERLYAEDITWDGRKYVISTFAPRVRTLTPEGVLSETREVLQEGAVETAIASNGDGFFLVWSRAGLIICTCPPAPQDLAGIALRADLSAAETAPRLFSDDDGPVTPNVVWDGHAYVVVWGSYKGVFASRVSMTPGVQSLVHTVAGGEASDVSAVAIAGGTAILWREWNSGLHRMRFLHRDGTLSQTITLNNDRNAALLLERRGHDALAYLYSAPQDGEPHHGASRIMMRIGTSTPAPSAPDAPQLAGTFRGRRSFLLEWTAPAEPVSGYRLQYRLGNGLWNEFETFFGPETRTFTYDTQAGVEISFRVRAIGDGGAGAYSNAVSVPLPPRRRAVR
jgi:hypothetical protein